MNALGKTVFRKPDLVCRERQADCTLRHGCHPDSYCSRCRYRQSADFLPLRSLGEIRVRRCPGLSASGAAPGLAAKTRLELVTDSWVRGMTFADDGKNPDHRRHRRTPAVVPGGGRGARTESFHRPASIEAHDGWIRAVATSVDGKLIASAG